jgi:hypothetical protein
MKNPGTALFICGPILDFRFWILDFGGGGFLQLGGFEWRHNPNSVFEAAPASRTEGRAALAA